MKRHPVGLSLIEVMIGLSLTALIMLAIFQAINASFMSFRSNQSQGMLAIRSRMVLMRLLDHVRATSLHIPLDPVKKAAWQASFAPVDDTGFKLAEVQSDGVSLIYYTYWLDTSNAANPQLKMTRLVGTTSTTNVLLNQVSSFNVRMWSGKSSAAATQNDILTRAVISLTAREQNTGIVTGNRITGSNTIPDTVSLSGSAVPRQNAWTGSCLAYSISAMLQRIH